MRLARVASIGMFLLASATVAWWSLLGASRAVRAAFLGPAGAFARDLGPFAAPDLAVLVPAALAASVGIARASRWAKAAAWTASGAATLGAGLAAWSLDWDPDRPFRVARAAPVGVHYAKTLVETVVLWGLFLGLFPILIAATERELGGRLDFPASIRPAGWTLFALASALGIWSGWTMTAAGEGTPLPRDTARRLVVSGPYRFVRNPMTMAGLAQAIGVGAILGSWAVALYALIGAGVWNTFARPAEERDLALRFGEPYERYRAAIPCWRPSRRPYRG